MKTIHEDDPRLTAFALGELDAHEAAELQALIDADPQLAAIVQEIQQSAAMLQSELAAEPSLQLTDLQRERISTQPQRQPAVIARGPFVLNTRRFWMGTGLAAAAMIALAVMTPIVQTERSKEQIAILTQPPTGTALGREALNSSLHLGVPTGAPLQSQNEPGLRSVRGRELVKKVEDAQSGVAAGQAIQGFAGDRRELRDESLQGYVASAAPGMPTSPPPPPPSPPPPASQPSISGLAEYPEDWPALRFPARPGKAGAGEMLGINCDYIHIAIDANTYQLQFDQDGDGHSDILRARFGTENYTYFADNPFLVPTEAPLSTFSADVDTASYANIRRFIMQNKSLPPKDAVRIEEMLNYFSFDYEPPTGDGGAPFSANIEVNAAPWQPEHRLVRVGIKGREVPKDVRPPTSLVFLIDVSGSMAPADKLPLIKQGLKLLLNELHGDDRLAIVTYAGQAGVLLDSAYATEQNKPQIITAIDSLNAGGSTNGAGGIVQAYEVAARHFITDGVNRVILCTDGDFNVGVSSEAELIRLIEEKRSTGVMLSVLGFGTGNLQDSKMKALSKHGNGNYAYIDSLNEARKVLIEQMGGTLIAIAKDVKFQVEFNPAKVASYRLIGYEQRILAAQDFNDDRKHAGEIGSGHTVTALYEIVPVGARTAAAPPPPVDDLKYQRKAETPTAKPAAPQSGIELVPSDDLLTLKIRYKNVEGSDDSSKLLEFPVKDQGSKLEQASTDFHFAAAVASFGMILRESPHKADSTLEKVLDMAGAGIGHDKTGRRAEFVQLVEHARALQSAK